MKNNYILLPVYNDFQSLKKVLKILNESFKYLKSKNHILVVNDHSSIKIKLDDKYRNFKSLKILNLRNNVGSQKAIFFGLKYLDKQIKNKNNQSIISVLDSDGEDDPKKLIQLIRRARERKDYFIFASRKRRTENFFLKSLNQIRLLVNFILTGKFINFGNFSSFSSMLLKKILSNNNLYLAYSSGVLKNYNKFIFVDVKKNKRLHGKSKVNLNFLINHSIKIISIFHEEVFLRSLLISTLCLFFLEPYNYKYVIIIFFIINITLFYVNFFLKPKKVNLSIIKDVEKYF